MLQRQALWLKKKKKLVLRELLNLDGTFFHAENKADTLMGFDLQIPRLSVKYVLPFLDSGRMRLILVYLWRIKVI